VSRPEPTPLVVYLAGTGHSGSTLVSFVLNNDPRIFSIGEMHAPVFPRDAPEKRACSCGSMMVDCAFFAKMRERLRDQGFDLDPSAWDLEYSRISANPLVDRLMVGSLRNSLAEAVRDRVWPLVPAYRRAIDRLDRFNVLFVRAALSISGKSIFFDATKDPIRIRHLRRLTGIRLRVIHIVRDPRAYAYSRIRDAGMSPEAAADAWVRTNRNCERHLRALPGAWMRMRYEDFCAENDATLAHIGEFLGIGPLTPTDDFRSAEHHIMGNKMRLPRFARSTIRLDEQWREKLPDPARAAVESLAGDLARSYGYR
jgi:hypothetical protein